MSEYNTYRFTNDEIEKLMVAVKLWYYKLRKSDTATKEEIKSLEGLLLTLQVQYNGQQRFI